MIVIPAVDIRGGKCVRLYQGRYDNETVYADDPVDMARKWEEMGAGMLHIVDLDGAKDANPVNREAVRRIVGELSIPCELGGGIRDMGTIEAYIEMGLERVILGTVAVKNPQLVADAAKSFPGGIVVGIDAKGGKVAVEGWTETTDEDAFDMARRFEDMGVRAINYTDISRDGAMVGPNIEATAKMVESIDIPVVAAGGVTKMNDLIELVSTGVEGAITGKALYEGTIDLERAIEEISKINTSSD